MLALPRIVCAAVMNKDGIIIPSPRHFDETFWKLFERMGLKEEDNHEWIQGFIDQFGKFFDREEALIIAKRENQIYRESPNVDTTELFSENLY